MSEPQEQQISSAPWLQATLQTLTGTHRDGRLGHALLIAGPRGVGKQLLAEALGHQLLEMPSPSTNHPDLHRVAPAEGKVALGVDQIRGLSGQLALTSHSAGPKVALLVPAEAMTLAAANALLKTLEEPAANTYLILVSHQPGRLPATIRSRCQTYTVRCPASTQALGWLKSQRGLDDRACREVLQLASGAPFLALSYCDSDLMKVTSELKDEIKAIAEGKIDPLSVAERWSKADPALNLDWLAGQVKALIRNLAKGNEVTDWAGRTLHNVAAPESLRGLLERADRIDKTRRLIDGSVNTEMTLRALLLGFAPTPPGKSGNSE